MNREKLKELYQKYDLSADDVYKHKHYLIITRSGIEKIQAKESILVIYKEVVTSPDYWAIKATAQLGDVVIETYGSAKYGDYKSGNTSTWYIAEMAEKRALSRAVLKLTGFYALGVFGEDESEDFKRSNNPKSNKEEILNKVN